MVPNLKKQTSYQIAKFFKEIWCIAQADFSHVMNHVFLGKSCFSLVVYDDRICISARETYLLLIMP
jgi:ABC-type protease/lipase transport system fused ATPase/permease subunit